MRKFRRWIYPLVAAIALVLAFGITFLVLFMTGKFDKPVIQPENISISLPEGIEGGVIRYNDYNIINGKIEAVISTTTEDVTEKNVLLYLGGTRTTLFQVIQEDTDVLRKNYLTTLFGEENLKNYITDGKIIVPSKVRIGENFDIHPMVDEYNSESNSFYNAGGVSLLTAESSDNKLIGKSEAVKISVDVPVEKLSVGFLDAETNELVKNNSDLVVGCVYKLEDIFYPQASRIDAFGNPRAVYHIIDERYEDYVSFMKTETGAIDNSRIMIVATSSTGIVIDTHTPNDISVISAFNAAVDKGAYIISNPEQFSFGQSTTGTIEKDITELSTSKLDSNINFKINEYITLYANNPSAQITMDKNEFDLGLMIKSEGKEIKGKFVDVYLVGIEKDISTGTYSNLNSVYYYYQGVEEQTRTIWYNPNAITNSDGVFSLTQNNALGFVVPVVAHRIVFDEANFENSYFKMAFSQKDNKQISFHPVYISNNGDVLPVSNALHTSTRAFERITVNEVIGGNIYFNPEINTNLQTDKAYSINLNSWISNALHALKENASYSVVKFFIRDSEGADVDMQEYFAGVTKYGLDGLLADEHGTKVFTNCYEISNSNLSIKQAYSGKFQLIAAIIRHDITERPIMVGGKYIIERFSTDNKEITISQPFDVEEESGVYFGVANLAGFNANDAIASIVADEIAPISVKQNSGIVLNLLAIFESQTNASAFMKAYPDITNYIHILLNGEPQNIAKPTIQIEQNASALSSCDVGDTTYYYLVYPIRVAGLTAPEGESAQDTIFTLNYKKAQNEDYTLIDDIEVKSGLRSQISFVNFEADAQYQITTNDKLEMAIQQGGEIVSNDLSAFLEIAAAAEGCDDESYTLEIVEGGDYLILSYESNAYVIKPSGITGADRRITFKATANDNPLNFAEFSFLYTNSTTVTTTFETNNILFNAERLQTNGKATTNLELIISTYLNVQASKISTEISPELDGFSLMGNEIVAQNDAQATEGIVIKITVAAEGAQANQVYNLKLNYTSSGEFYIETIQSDISNLQKSEMAININNISDPKVFYAFYVNGSDEDITFDLKISREDLRNYFEDETDGNRIYFNTANYLPNNISTYLKITTKFNTYNIPITFKSDLHLTHDAAAVNDPIEMSEFAATDIDLSNFKLSLNDGQIQWVVLDENGVPYNNYTSKRGIITFGDVFEQTRLKLYAIYDSVQSFANATLVGDKVEFEGVEYDIFTENYVHYRLSKNKDKIYYVDDPAIAEGCSDIKYIVKDGRRYNILFKQLDNQYAVAPIAGQTEVILSCYNDTYPFSIHAINLTLRPNFRLEYDEEDLNVALSPAAETIKLYGEDGIFAITRESGSEAISYPVGFEYWSGSEWLEYFVKTDINSSFISEHILNNGLIADGCQLKIKLKLKNDNGQSYTFAEKVITLSVTLLNENILYFDGTNEEQSVEDVIYNNQTYRKLIDAGDHTHNFKIEDNDQIMFITCDSGDFDITQNGTNYFIRCARDSVFEGIFTSSFTVGIGKFKQVVNVLVMPIDFTTLISWDYDKNEGEIFDLSAAMEKGVRLSKDENSFEFIKDYSAVVNPAQFILDNAANFKIDYSTTGQDLQTYLTFALATATINEHEVVNSIIANYLNVSEERTGYVDLIAFIKNNQAEYNYNLRVKITLEKSEYVSTQGPYLDSSYNLWDKNYATSEKDGVPVLVVGDANFEIAFVDGDIAHAKVPVQIDSGIVTVLSREFILEGETNKFISSEFTDYDICFAQGDTERVLVGEPENGEEYYIWIELHKNPDEIIIIEENNALTMFDFNVISDPTIRDTARVEIKSNSTNNSNEVFSKLIYSVDSIQSATGLFIQSVDFGSYVTISDSQVVINNNAFAKNMGKITIKFNVATTSSDYCGKYGEKMSYTVELRYADYSYSATATNGGNAILLDETSFNIKKDGNIQLLNIEISRQDEMLIEPLTKSDSLIYGDENLYKIVNNFNSQFVNVGEQTDNTYKITGLNYRVEPLDFCVSFVDVFGTIAVTNINRDSDITASSSTASNMATILPNRAKQDAPLTKIKNKTYFASDDFTEFQPDNVKNIELLKIYKNSGGIWKILLDTKYNYDLFNGEVITIDTVTLTGAEHTQLANATSFSVSDDAEYVFVFNIAFQSGAFIANFDLKLQSTEGNVLISKNFKNIIEDKLAEDKNYAITEAKPDPNEPNKPAFYKDGNLQEASINGHIEQINYIYYSANETSGSRVYLIQTEDGFKTAANLNDAINGIPNSDIIEIEKSNWSLMGYDYGTHNGNKINRLLFIQLETFKKQLKTDQATQIALFGAVLDEGEDKPDYLYYAKVGQNNYLASVYENFKECRIIDAATFNSITDGEETEYAAAVNFVLKGTESGLEIDGALTELANALAVPSNDYPNMFEQPSQITITTREIATTQGKTEIKSFSDKIVTINENTSYKFENGEGDYEDIYMIAYGYNGSASYSSFNYGYEPDDFAVRDYLRPITFIRAVKFNVLKDDGGFIGGRNLKTSDLVHTGKEDTDTSVSVRLIGEQNDASDNYLVMKNYNAHINGFETIKVVDGKIEGTSTTLNIINFNGYKFIKVELGEGATTIFGKTFERTEENKLSIYKATYQSGATINLGGENYTLSIIKIDDARHILLENAEESIALLQVALENTSTDSGFGFKNVKQEITTKLTFELIYDFGTYSEIVNKDFNFKVFPAVDFSKLAFDYINPDDYNACPIGYMWANSEACFYEINKDGTKNALDELVNDAFTIELDGLTGSEKMTGDWNKYTLKEVAGAESGHIKITYQATNPDGTDFEDFKQFDFQITKRFDYIANYPSFENYTDKNYEVVAAAPEGELKDFFAADNALGTAKRIEIVDISKQTTATISEGVTFALSAASTTSTKIYECRVNGVLAGTYELHIDQSPFRFIPNYTPVMIRPNREVESVQIDGTDYYVLTADQNKKVTLFQNYSDNYTDGEDYYMFAIVYDGISIPTAMYPAILDAYDGSEGELKINATGGTISRDTNTDLIQVEVGAVQETNELSTSVYEYGKVDLTIEYQGKAAGSLHYYIVYDLARLNNENTGSTNCEEFNDNGNMVYVYSIDQGKQYDLAESFGFSKYYGEPFTYEDLSEKFTVCERTYDGETFVGAEYPINSKVTYQASDLLGLSGNSAENNSAYVIANAVRNPGNNNYFEIAIELKTGNELKFYVRVTSSTTAYSNSNVINLETECVREGNAYTYNLSNFLSVSHENRQINLTDLYYTVIGASAITEFTQQMVYDLNTIWDYVDKEECSTGEFKMPNGKNVTIEIDKNTNEVKITFEMPELSNSTCTIRVMDTYGWYYDFNVEIPAKNKLITISPEEFNVYGGMLTADTYFIEQLNDCLLLNGTTFTQYLADNSYTATYSFMMNCEQIEDGKFKHTPNTEFANGRNYVGELLVTINESNNTIDQVIIPNVTLYPKYQLALPGTIHTREGKEVTAAIILQGAILKCYNETAKGYETTTIVANDFSYGNGTLTRTFDNTDYSWTPNITEHETYSALEAQYDITSSAFYIEIGQSELTSEGLDEIITERIVLKDWNGNDLEDRLIYNDAAKTQYGDKCIIMRKDDDTAFVYRIIEDGTAGATFDDAANITGVVPGSKLTIEVGYVTQKDDFRSYTASEGENAIKVHIIGTFSIWPTQPSATGNGE